MNSKPCTCYQYYSVQLSRTTISRFFGPLYTRPRFRFTISPLVVICYIPIQYLKLSKVFAYVNQWQALRNLMGVGAKVFSALRSFATIFSAPLHKSSCACVLRGASILLPQSFCHSYQQKFNYFFNCFSRFTHFEKH